MIIRSDCESLPKPTPSPCESLPKPTPSPCTRVPFSVSVFHCRRVVCACSAVPLVHSLINHFRQMFPLPRRFLISNLVVCLVQTEPSVLTAIPVHRASPT